VNIEIDAETMPQMHFVAPLPKIVGEATCVEYQRDKYVARADCRLPQPIGAGPIATR
jgi:hypothetical protein